MTFWVSLLVPALSVPAMAGACSDISVSLTVIIYCCSTGAAMIGAISVKLLHVRFGDLLCLRGETPCR